MIDSKDTSREDYRRFVRHIGYIAGRAKSDKFSNAAHAQYDLAVRKLALDDGFKAFTAGNSELSLKYYALEFLKPTRHMMNRRAPL